MADTLTGVMTNRGREVLAKSLGNIGGFPLVRAVKFAYGEGGYQIVGGGRVPKVPDPSLTDIEADGVSLFRFEKSYVPADITFIAPSTIEFRNKENPSEANDNGFGASPKFFELGLYDDDDNLLVYSTFDEQTKVATKSLSTYLQVFF